MLKNSICISFVASLILFTSCSSSEEVKIEEQPTEDAVDPVGNDDPNEAPIGTINGTIKLVDEFGVESFEYQGTVIKLLQEKEVVKQFDFQADSIYTIPDFEIGEYIMVVEKEGYGAYDTLRIENTLENNKLSQIEILEFPKVDVNLVTVDYTGGQIFREVLPCFESNRSQTIRYEYFFSKDATVSFQNYGLKYAAGTKFGNTNITRPCSQITGPASTWETYAFSNFLEAGFSSGDTVYVLIYPNHELFYGTDNQDYKDKNFEVIQHIRSNGSNTVAFIL